MEVICIEDDALIKLVKDVVDKLEEGKKHSDNPWICTEEAKVMLNIKSATTLQKLRDENKIIFTKTTPKVFLYDRNSILEYHNKNSNKDLQ